jgi:hypothetical protein
MNEQPYQDRLRPLLVGHDVFTVAFMKWRGIGNGKLLKLAADAGFDALITRDTGIEYEQNLTQLPCAVIMLKLRSNSVRSIRLAVPLLQEELDHFKPKTLVKLTTIN